jgi:hypothetical protein
LLKEQRHVLGVLDGCAEGDGRFAIEHFAVIGFGVAGNAALIHRSRQFVRRIFASAHLEVVQPCNNRRREIGVATKIAAFLQIAHRRPEHHRLKHAV